MATASLGRLTLDLVTKIGNFTGPMTQAERQAKSSSKNIANSFSVASIAATAFGAAIAGVSIGSMAAFADQTIQTGSEIKKFAQLANTSVRDFQFYAKGAETAGISMGVEKVSEIKEVSTTSYLLNMPFSSDKNDHGKFGLTAKTVGSAVIQDGYLYVPDGSYIRFNTTGITELNLGTSNFEFGIEVALMPTGGGSYPCVFGVGTGWSSGAISMQFNPSSRFMCAIMSPGEKDAFAPTDQTRDGTTFVKYVVRRVAGVWTTYKDGIAGTPFTDSKFIANFTRNGVITIGAAIWDVGITASHSKIKNVYLRKL